LVQINWELLNSLKVGILGCGHLGQAIARSLISRGLEKENLFISYKGNPLTRQKLDAQGLALCLTTNQRLFQESRIVLITIKPQDILELKGTVVFGKTLVVSCMAGVPIELLHRILETDVYRMMFSGPDTIIAGNGVVAMYPEHGHLNLLIRALNLTPIGTRTENDLDIFTAGVCMPAALLKVENPIERKMAVERIGMEYPLLSELYVWALKVLPHFYSSVDQKEYMERMITKGGITEAIINSLTNGAQFDAALRKGIARIKEISVEIQQSIINRAPGKSSRD
jgi:pyrroline-5-carboxylate reductase